MADKGNINPKELAKDIQKNVDAALHDPTNAKALEALHKDAQLLDGHLSQKKDGQFVDHNKVLQDKVQAELNKLEASGALPKVEINMSGQIEASTRLPGYHTVELYGRSHESPNQRLLQARPDGETKVWDEVGDR